MKKNTILNVLICLITTGTFGQDSGNCAIPSIPVISGPSDICTEESATLTATSDGDTILWFDAAINGNQIGVDSPFNTGDLSVTTTFWAEAQNVGLGNITTGGARLAPSSNSNGIVNPGTAPWGLVFDAYDDFVLNSVDVFLASASPGTLVVQLKDINFNIVDVVTIATPAGSSSNPLQFTVNLDFDIPAGNGWRLVASESPAMVREFSSGHPGFPYPIGTLGSVTQGTINDSNTSNAALYYYFYNWSFTPYSLCVSDRAAHTVNVNVTPIPVGDSVQGYNLGDTLADFDVTGQNLTWYEDEDGNIELPETTPIVEGVTYYVSQTILDCESEFLSVLGQLNLGVADFNFTDLNYYPNPFTDVLHVSNTAFIENIAIYSITGQLIKSFDNASSEITLDLADLSKGIYLLQITAEGETKTVKLVKQ